MSQLQDSTRQEVFDQRGHECLFCGVTGEQHRQEYGRDLDVHHVIPSSKGGSDDPENLIPVCRSCHQQLEATQGKALGRICEKESDQQEMERLENRIEELEGEVHEREEEILDALDAVDELLDATVSGTVYLVHETRMTTSRLLYAGTSIESAESAFEQAEYHVTMETARVNISDWASDLSSAQLEIIKNESADVRTAIHEHVYGGNDEAEGRMR